MKGIRDQTWKDTSNQDKEINIENTFKLIDKIIKRKRTTKLKINREFSIDPR